MKKLLMYAGNRAREHIAREGLKPADVQAVPGAAGGPKGLILHGLDQFLFSDWLNDNVERQLIGASIGAWRMAAACSPNPRAAIDRLAQQYCEAQCYRKGATIDEITAVCDGMINTIVADESQAMTQHNSNRLIVWVNRGRPPVYAAGGRAKKRGFAAAVLANTASRGKLGRYLERIVYSPTNAPLEWLQQSFDTLPTEFHALDQQNLKPALLASGSIPFVLHPVAQIPGSPPGPYWDGGLTDYHLALPYHRLKGLVLYPHFVRSITPGWLDKWVKHRRAPEAWLSNMLLICPSPEFIASLPAKKIPDRSDFTRYNFDHEMRMSHWRTAMQASHQLAEELAAFIARPDVTELQPLGDARR
jgi:predicted acylesterase/phospholipase RssA